MDPSWRSWCHRFPLWLVRVRTLARALAHMDGEDMRVPPAHLIDEAADIIGPPDALPAGERIAWRQIRTAYANRKPGPKPPRPTCNIS